MTNSNPEPEAGQHGKPPYGAETYWREHDGDAGVDLPAKDAALLRESIIGGAHRHQAEVGRWIQQGRAAADQAAAARARRQRWTRMIPWMTNPD